MYGTQYDKLQPYFGQDNIQLHYLGNGSFVLSIKTENIIKDLKILEDMFDFSNSDEKHEIFSFENKKSI